MRIISFGSSHTVGYKLSDVQNAHYNAVSKFAFPNIVADHFKCPCINYAKCANPMDQLFADVLGYFPYSQPDDFIILQLSTNPNWFSLVTPDNNVTNIINPDSMNGQKSEYKKILQDYLGKLTSDSHWRRIWYLYFFGLMHVLYNSNKRFVWFFDRYSEEYLEFDRIVNFFPPEMANQMIDIRNSTPDSSNNFIPEIYSIWLEEHCPESVMDDGHHNDIGHKFWADNILIPNIEKRLT